VIASCWDWPSLKYAYFVIEGEALDAGGWSPTRGIVSNQSTSSSQDSVSFDDCLPSLPKSCFYAGAGDFCIGEMFQKRDPDRRPELNIAEMKAQGTPDMKKIVELLEDTAVSPVERLRGVDFRTARENEGSGGATVPRVTPPRRTLWSFLVPSFGAAGAGYAMYRLMGSEKGTDLAVRNILFSWATGLAVGIAVGQEYARQPSVRESEGN